MEEYLDLLLDVFLDSLKMAPILYLVYLLLEWVQTRWSPDHLRFSKGVAPLIGGLAGLIPQCGISAAATYLYEKSAIGLGPLVAVYLSTSDEAVPLLLTHPSSYLSLIALLLVKAIFSILFGCLIALLFDRKHPSPKEHSHLPQGSGSCGHQHESGNLFWAALWHTAQICLFVFVSLLLIQSLLFFAGEEAVFGVLKEAGIFTPVLAGLVGLIPGCGTSVLITQFYLEGALSFGSCVAGLSSGAGFGLLILLRSHLPWKKKLLPLGLLLVCSILTGIFTDVLLSLCGIVL